MEPHESLIRALVSQGGFALLAFAFGQMGYKGAQMWVADVKSAGERERALMAAGAERERALMERVLDLVKSQTEALAANNSSIAAVRQEVETLRAHLGKSPRASRLPP